MSAVGTPYVNPPTPDPFPLQRNQQPYLDVQGVRFSWNPRTGKYEDQAGRAMGSPGTPGGGPILAPPPEAPPSPPPPPSYDPIGGANAPTFTPGIVFGQGVIPGQGQGGSPYQRQWFDVGGDPHKETVNNAFYNNPSNWDVAWQKAINQFGGTPGSAYGDFLNSWSTTGQREFNNIAPYDPNVNVADFIDAYAPQLKGVFGLMSPANRGQRGSVTGFDRAAY